MKGLERWELQRADAPSLGLPGTSALKTGAQTTARTVVRMTSDYTMPGLIGKAMDWLVTRHAVARRNQDNLARLKRYAEHGEPE